MADTHIKIKPVTPRVQYTANGSTTVFPYSFAIFDETDMVVYVDDTIITTGYTVSGAGQTDGGNVTFDSAPEDGKKITLLRNVSIERVTDFQEGGTFRPKNINDEFDRQTAFAQQVQEALSRCVKVDPTSSTNPEEILPKVEELYDHIDNIDSVAADLTNIDAVNANKINIDAVAENKTNIDTVAGISTDVSEVANISQSVSSVADNETNINNVADDLNNIDAVAGISGDVSTVAGNTTDISNVATNMSDVNDCANNMEAIQDAPNQAQAAADSAALAYQYGNDKINQTHISNCITYIPQDIKVDFSNSTITIKAGSKIYPSYSPHTPITFTEDKTLSVGYGNPGIVFYDIQNNTLFSLDNGNIYTSGTPYVGLVYEGGRLWRYNNRTLVSNQVSIALCEISTDGNTVITSVNKVFNGFGYFGSTVFALPGVKGLIPNGRNEDGTLRNTEFTISSVKTYTPSQSLTMTVSVVIDGDISIGYSGNYIYDEEKNKTFDSSSKRPCCFITDCYLNNSSITKFNHPKTVFHAVDYNDAVKYSDKQTIVGWGMPNYSAAVSVATGTDTTKDTNGVVYFSTLSTNGGQIAVYIDGQQVFNSENSGGYIRPSACFFVPKGKTFKVISNVNMIFCNFAPCIGG